MPGQQGVCKRFVNGRECTFVNGRGVANQDQSATRRV